MDIESFSNDNFDAVEWINSTFKNNEQKDEKEVFVAGLVSKLQLYVQQVNSALEDTSQKVLVDMPRIIKDSNNLHSEVKNLHVKVKEVVQTLEVQSKTEDCMTNLERLDTLKEKLQIAKESLQESDGWGKLVSELEDLFERNDLSKICEKLSSLQKSLIAQEKLVGQSEREVQVEGFKNRLEALASPAVVQCFSTSDAEQTKKYVKIFTTMNRMEQLLQYYRTVQKTALQQHWNEILDLGNSNRFLYDYYEYLGENYLKQFKWSAQVFEDKGVDQALIIVIEILSSLQPSREATILDSLKRSNEKLDVLEELSNANIYFANLMEQNFESTYGPDPQQLKVFYRSIFDYFNTFIAQYPAIEQNNLATRLVNLNLIQSTPTETIRSLGNANKKIIEWSDEAMKRCEIITQNCAISPLVTVLQSIYKNFIEKYKKAQQQLSANRSVEQNWSLLQSCMSLLQNFGDFCKNLQTFEKELSMKILQTSDKIQKHSKQSGYRLIEKRDINELKKLIQKIKADQEKALIDGDSYFGLFESILEMIKPICDDIHDATLSIVFVPIEKQLNSIEPPDHFNSGSLDLPDYSYAPQEFITQIGQYLLTLPQHLEPILLSPSPSLKFALEICDKKYQENIPSTDVLLSLVVEECCAMYQNQILQMKSVSNSSAKQMATDIEYLGNVLEELGSSTTNHLQQTAILLRALPENYLSTSTGCEPRLVTAIRQMRNIISTE